MIILGGTTALVDLVTSAAGTVQAHVSWVDRDNGAPPVEVPGSENYIISTATTTTIGESPTGVNKRNLKLILVRNAHATVSNTITVRHNDGTNTVELAEVTLLPSEKLIIDDNGVVFVYDAQGGVKGPSSGGVDPSINDFRLTGVSATPVMTSDNAALSTIYLAQHKGNAIALFDGVNWQLAEPPAEVSLAVTGRTTDLPFDIFAYLNTSGVVTLEFLNWTNATTRATGLTRVDGVWTKTGDSTRRYLGSCRARSATTFAFVRSTADVSVKLDLWNNNNRVETSFMLWSLTNSWAYTLATWRQAQALATMQVDIMVGLQQETFNARLAVTSRNSTISIPRHVGIGYDVTTAILAASVSAATANTVISIEAHQMAQIAHQPAIGRHFYAWLEISTATGTCTWIGDDGALRLMSGMTGSWES